MRVPMAVVIRLEMLKWRDLNGWKLPQSSKDPCSVFFGRASVDWCGCCWAVHGEVVGIQRSMERRRFGVERTDSSRDRHCDCDGDGGFVCSHSATSGGLRIGQSILAASSRGPRKPAAEVSSRRASMVTTGRLGDRSLPGCWVRPPARSLWMTREAWFTAP